jgi:hypothetical protein
MISAPKTLKTLLAALNPRQKDIIVGRFAIEKPGEGETLAAIGERFGITRERVRQIEKSALEALKKEALASTACAQILNLCKKQLKDAGGVLSQKTLLETSRKSIEGLNENNLALLVAASNALNFYKEDENFWPFYYLTENDLAAATDFIDGWTKFLRDSKQKVIGGPYQTHLANFAKARKIAKNYAENYLNISKKIHSNPYGDIGLKEWPEIFPSTTRDKIYLVLKKHGEPLHFEDIARTINKIGFGARPALAPTVHNELIKDERFVLVGRGTYALREHGYEPGIAREIIQKVLKKHGPLSKDEVIAHVSKQRFFKPNTILINLQNRNYFERLQNGKYTLRES